VTTGDDVFRQIQRKARADGAKSGTPVPTAAYLTRHGLESFLDRLTRTPHADDFILKGGILLAVYGVRRPTKDIDAEAVSASITVDHIEQVVRDVVAVPVNDGVDFDLGSITVEVIRDGAEYPGLRVRIGARIGSYSVVIPWDISTGDPIVPEPQIVTMPRILGDPVRLLGYAPETIIAEKGVTILERGMTSTRWRDYIDIVALAKERAIDNDLLLSSSRAVARYRQVELRPVGPVVVGYGDIAQAKWAARRSKEGVQDLCEENLDDQMASVIAVLDPVFARGLGG
jgi:hypothetical protein